MNTLKQFQDKLENEFQAEKEGRNEANDSRTANAAQQLPIRPANIAQTAALTTEPGRPKNRRSSPSIKPFQYVIDLTSETEEEEEEEEEEEDEEVVDSSAKRRKSTHQPDSDNSSKSSFIDQAGHTDRGLPRQGLEIAIPRSLIPTSISPSKLANVLKKRGRPRKYHLHESNGQHQQTLVRKEVVPRPRKDVIRSREQTEYAQRLKQLNGPIVTLYNDIDNSTPPKDFVFIDDYVFTGGIQRLGAEFQSGCTCRKQNGRDIGCEYRTCECLEDAHRDERGNLLGFPYHGVNEKKSCLRDKYLKTRAPVYECNELCNCPPHCKNKVVQKGRQIPLEIFKTTSRGWGLRCPVDIRKGRFVDTYRGEVITDAEATVREETGVAGKPSYLYSLDKFREDDATAPNYNPASGLYVIDGEFMGGPTRFLNHSCNPNLRQYAVLTVKGDSKVYHLAFFAVQDIPAYTELTFDYLDKDDEEAGESDLTAENLQEKEEEKGQSATKCLCGQPNCRKFLWL